MRANSLQYLLLAAIAITGMTYAAMGSSVALSARLNQLNGTLLQTAFAQANCKVNFTVSYLDQAIQVIPNASTQLSGSISTLDQVSIQLQSYESGGSVSSYRAYVTGAFDPALSSIRSVFKTAVRSANPTPSQVQQLYRDYNSTISQYRQCEFSSLKQFALNKLSYYQTALSSYQQEAINLSAKGLQVGAMESDVSTANSTIVLPFSAAINSATNASQLEAAIRGYCLFDGCSGGLNGHLAAHFGYDKLSAVAAKLQTYNLTANQTAELNTARGYLSAADSALSQAGTSGYTAATDPWGDLHNASAALRLALKR